MDGTNHVNGRAELRERDGVLVGAAAELPIGDDGDWYAAGFFGIEDEELVLVELRVFPAEGGRPSDWVQALAEGSPGIGEWARDAGPASQSVTRLSASLIRKATIDGLTDLAKQLVRDAVEAAPETRLQSGGDELVAAARRPRGPGRPGHPDLFYAIWAARQVDKINAGSTAPNRDLGREHGDSVASIAQWIHEARRRGLLEQTRQGRIESRLTPKATQILASDDREIREGMRGLGLDPNNATKKA